MCWYNITKQAVGWIWTVGSCLSTPGLKDLQDTFRFTIPLGHETAVLKYLIYFMLVFNILLLWLVSLGSLNAALKLVRFGNWFIVGPLAYLFYNYNQHYRPTNLWSCLELCRAVWPGTCHPLLLLGTQPPHMLPYDGAAAPSLHTYQYHSFSSFQKSNLFSRKVINAIAGTGNL